MVDWKALITTLVIQIVTAIGGALWIRGTRQGQAFWRKLGRVVLPESAASAVQYVSGVRLAVIIALIAFLISLTSAVVVILRILFPSDWEGNISSVSREGSDRICVTFKYLDPRFCFEHEGNFASFKPGKTESEFNGVEGTARQARPPK